MAIHVTFLTLLNLYFLLKFASYWGAPLAINPLQIILGSFSCLGLLFLITSRHFKTSVTTGELAFGTQLRWMLIFLSPLAALSFHVSNNPAFLDNFSFFALALCFVAISLLCFGALRLLTRKQVGADLSAAATAIFIFLFLLMPTLRSFLALEGNQEWIFVLLLYGLSRSSFFWARKKTGLFLATFLGVFLLMNAVKIGIFKFEDEKSSSQALPAVFSERPLVSTPNVYLLSYDGIPNEEVFKELKIDFSNLGKLLKEFNFKIYPNTYSMMSSTERSIAGTLNLVRNIKSTEVGSQVVAGKSLVDEAFKKAGYQRIKILHDSLWGDVVDADEVHYDLPAELHRTNQFLKMLRALLYGEFRTDTVGYAPMESTAVENSFELRRIILETRKSKTYFFSHLYLPGHSSFVGKCESNGVEMWSRKLEDLAIPQMRRDFEAILKNDPGALIIAFGDHGPHLTGDCARLRNWKEEITKLHILDRFGSLVAIHWPDKQRANLFDYRLKTNQDIFQSVFAYLSGDAAYLELSLDGRGRVLNTLGVRFKDGALLPPQSP